MGQIIKKTAYSNRLFILKAKCIFMALFLLFLPVGCGKSSTTSASLGSGSLSVTGSSLVITVDYSTNSASASSFSIATSQTNELIVIAADGYPAAGTPTVTVDGSAATQLVLNSSGSNPGVASLFYYTAPSIGSHAIVVTETGVGSSYYNNMAVSLLNATATGIAAYSINPAACQSQAGSIGTTTSNQFIVLTSNGNTGSAAAGTATWTGSPVAPTALQSTHGGSGVDSFLASFLAPSAASYSFTMTDSISCGSGGILLGAVINHQ